MSETDLGRMREIMGATDEATDEDVECFVRCRRRAEEKYARMRAEMCRQIAAIGALDHETIVVERRGSNADYGAEAVEAYLLRDGTRIALPILSGRWGYGSPGFGGALALSILATCCGLDDILDDVDRHGKFAACCLDRVTEARLTYTVSQIRDWLADARGVVRVVSVEAGSTCVGDIRLCAIDVGFDPRVVDMAAVIPAGEYIGRSVGCETAEGSQVLLSGRRDAVVTYLRRQGYQVAPRRRVTCMTDTSA